MVRAATTRKTKTEEVIVRQGMTPLKSSAAAKGGSRKPSGVMTGAGKVKSASASQQEPTKARSIGKSSAKDKAGAIVAKGHPEMEGSATKMGMAKSAKLGEPKIATNLKSGGARAKPAEKPFPAASAKGRTKKS